jgi:hypothetical protein
MSDCESPRSWYVARHDQIVKTHAAIKGHLSRYLPHGRGVASFCHASEIHFHRPSP